ncbi:MAG: chromate transporter [Clostridia bacterium]|nr:chromate transporter [Clostridia bacterium]
MGSRDKTEKKSLIKTLAELALTFFRIGLFTFGGGYAMISIIEHDCVEKRAWITHDDMMNITVIAESTPGPVAINCATFVGYKRAGLTGAACATLGVVLPSFIIIYLISLFLNGLLEIKAVASAFRGIKLAVGVLIVQAAVNMIRKMKKDALAVAILSLSFAAMLLINIFALDFSSISLMLIAAAVSLAAYCVSLLKNRKEGEK